MNLEEIRKKINSLDGELVRLLDERMKLSVLVAEDKIKSGAPVLCNEREKLVLDRIDSLIDSNNHEIKTVMKSVMALSRIIQYRQIIQSVKDLKILDIVREAKGRKTEDRKIAFSGKSGSYAEAAAIKMYPQAEQFAGYQSFYDACMAVAEGEADIAVLPLENTTAGTVNEVYDLLPLKKLYIVKSMSDSIFHSLLAVQGARLEEIDTVISHPQALSQCSNFIKRMGWKTVKSINTAYAAEEVALKGLRNLAAIGSEASARAYGLNVIDKEINNEMCNQTKFIALSEEFKIEEQANKISLAFKLPHKPGSLAWILYMFAGLSLNLSKIQSRPITDRPWEYIFYADFLYDDEDNALQALYQLEQEVPEFYLLGWYRE